MNSLSQQNVHIQSLPGNMIHMLGVSICSSRMQVFGCSIQRHDVALDLLQGNEDGVDSISEITL